MPNPTELIERWRERSSRLRRRADGALSPSACAAILTAASVYECCADQLNEALRDAWVSVESRLPEKPGMYLVCRVAHWGYEVGTDWWDRDEWTVDGHVTHWQPLPRPPGEKSGATSVTVPKIARNMSTPEAREFWRSCEAAAAEVSTWPASRRAGINVHNGSDDE